MIKIDQAISSRWMITMNGKSLIEDHSIAIDGNTIREILPTKDLLRTYEVTNHINLKEQIVLPGLINNQIHSPIALGKENKYQLKRISQKEYSNIVIKYMIAEMLKNGITTFSDVGLSPDITIEQVNQTGIRANIGLPIFKYKSFWAKDEKIYLSKSLAIYDEFKNDPNVNLSIHLDSIAKLSKDTILKVSEIANELDIPIRMSLNESQKEIDKCKSKYKLRPLQYLQKIGILSNTFSGMNMAIFSNIDLNIIKKHKANVINCPNAHLKSYLGIFETKKLMENNINISLGTGDSHLNHDIDMLDEIKITGLLSKLDKVKKNDIKSSDLLKLITINSAKSFGLDHKIGKLEVGQLADIISIKVDIHKYKEGLNTNTLNNHLKSTNITNVWISGKHIVKNKKLLTINEKLLYDKLVKLRK
tara:strand:- start:800 stop:2053 length:1254 start_codon:yes stop_codon:yes gene_type:complete